MRINRRQTNAGENRTPATSVDVDNYRFASNRVESCESGLFSQIIALFHEKDSFMIINRPIAYRK